ncbi:hypothetical protein [Clostridium botulinum]|uniref:hypothetical protein n=1 Tax=Clostridium botulinum TaxID=1491 RepID=UPI001C9A6F9F|nr:hypothetical protein [Clostridium botulinum]MBY6948409.1 hypothetical protein [Clostridium botulinum]MBY7021378.1 hypothetical protein [Clostridium botulinum]
MEYISAKEFRKQPMEVQQVIFEWWKPSKGDLFENDLIGGFGVITGEKKLKNGLIPLLTEGQLRRFIENKTESKILRIFLNEFEVGTKTFKRYCIHLTNARIFMNQSDSLFQSYWKVACQIANKEVVEHGQTK